MSKIFWEGFSKYGPAGALLWHGTGNVSNVMPAGTSMVAGEWTGFHLSGLVSNNQTIALDTGRFTGASLKIASNQALGGVTQAHGPRRGLLANHSTLIFGTAVKSNFGGNTSVTFQDGNVSQLTVCVNTSGQIEVRSGHNGTVLATSAAVISQNIWGWLSGKVVIHNTTGSWDIHLDNLQVLSATGQNTRGGTVNNYANAVWLNNNWPVPAEGWFDCFFLFDDTGSVNNAIRTDSRVETQFATSDSAVQFAPAVGVLGAFQRGATATSAPGANQLVLRPYTPEVSCTLNSVSWVPAASSGSVKWKPVAYNEAGGIPVTLLSTGNEQIGATLGMAITGTLTSPPTLTGGTRYWVGFITDTSILLQLQDGGVSGYRAANTYTSGAPGTAPAMTASQPSWLLWGNVSGMSPNYAEVNDAIPSGLLSYVSDSVVGHEDLYGFPALPAGVSSVAGVKISAFCARSDAGAKTVSLRVKSGATDAGGTAQTPATDMAYINSYFETDPNTSVAWTASGVNAATSGQKIDS